jgi:hypothetical protein
LKYTVERVLIHRIASAVLFHVGRETPKLPETRDFRRWLAKYSDEELMGMSLLGWQALAEEFLASENAP